MWPVIAANLLRYGIPVATGLGTAYDIYQKTGDIGKASVGGAVSGAGSYGLGLAGQKLAGMAGNRLWPSAAPGLVSGSTALGMRTVSSGIPALVEVAGNAFGLPAMAGGIAAGLTPGILGPNKDRMAGDILRKGGETAGTVAQMTAQEPSGAWNATPPPNLNQWGPDNYATVANPLGSAAAQILRGKLEAQGQLAQLKTLLPYQMEMINKAANADLERQAAGAQMRTRLAQGAQSMLQAQLGAQQLAQQGNQAVLQAAAQRGGYV